jgi:hypothetical protein
MIINSWLRVIQPKETTIFGNWKSIGYHWDPRRNRWPAKNVRFTWNLDSENRIRMYDFYRVKLLEKIDKIDLFVKNYKKYQKNV